MSMRTMSSVCTVLWRKKKCIIPTLFILIALGYFLLDGSQVTSFSESVKSKLPSDIQGAIDGKFRALFKGQKGDKEQGGDDDDQEGEGDEHGDGDGDGDGVDGNAKDANSDVDGPANEAHKHAHSLTGNADSGDKHANGDVVDEHANHKDHHDDVIPAVQESSRRNNALEDLTTLPGADTIKTWSDDQLAFMFYRYTTRLQYKCETLTRMSVLANDTWMICVDELFKPKQDCLVYSFGLKDVTQVEKYLASRLQCEVHYFQPNVEESHAVHVAGVNIHAIGLAAQNGVTEHGWRVRTLNKLIYEMGHQNRTIDILKIDLEKWEWEALPEVVESGALNHVNQLLLAMHATKEPSPQNYRDRLIMFQLMYSMNFRIANIVENKDKVLTRLQEMLSTEIEILFLRMPAS